MKQINSIKMIRDTNKKPTKLARNKRKRRRALSSPWLLYISYSSQYLSNFCAKSLSILFMYVFVLFVMIFILIFLNFREVLTPPFYLFLFRWRITKTNTIATKTIPMPISKGAQDTWGWIVFDFPNSANFSWALAKRSCSVGLSVSPEFFLASKLFITVWRISRCWFLSSSISINLYI